MLLAGETQGTHDGGNQPSKIEFFTPTLARLRRVNLPRQAGGTPVGPPILPWVRLGFTNLSPPLVGASPQTSPPLVGGARGGGKVSSRNCQTLGVPRQSRGFTQD